MTSKHLHALVIVVTLYDISMVVFSIIFLALRCIYRKFGGTNLENAILSLVMH